MRCPNCIDVSLKAMKVRKTNVSVNACETCKGVWFDASELNQVLDVAKNNLKPPGNAKETQRICPRCPVPLKTFPYPQTLVQVDMCNNCSGLWLDPREFREIKIIRENLKKKGKLADGIKGSLLNFINSAIERLADFE